MLHRCEGICFLSPYYFRRRILASFGDDVLGVRFLLITPKLPFIPRSRGMGIWARFCRQNCCSSISQGPESSGDSYLPLDVLSHPQIYWIIHIFKSSRTPQWSSWHSSSPPPHLHRWLLWSNHHSCPLHRLCHLSLSSALRGPVSPPWQGCCWCKARTWVRRTIQ